MVYWADAKIARTEITPHGAVMFTSTIFDKVTLAGVPASAQQNMFFRVPYPQNTTARVVPQSQCTALECRGRINKGLFAENPELSKSLSVCLSLIF